jgi:hypothetical protein
MVLTECAAQQVKAAEAMIQNANKAEGIANAHAQELVAQKVCIRSASWSRTALVDLFLVCGSAKLRSSGFPTQWSRLS